MNGLIILDGPDGSGKTTLAREIVRQTGGHYMHLTYRFPDKMFTYQLAELHRAVKLSQHKMVVIDRHWMSEVCYANAYRNGSKWPYMGRMMDRIILKHAGLYVLALPRDIERHLKEYEQLKNERAEMYSSIGPVVIEYHKLWEKIKSWPHVRRYDWRSSNVSLETTASDLIMEQQEWQDLQWAPALNPNNYSVCGHIDSAEFLLIGDRTNPNKRRGLWYPFVDYQGTSLHVTKVLEELGIPEHKLMWINYHQAKGAFKELVNTYAINPIVFGSTTLNDILNDFGGMSSKYVVKGVKVSALTYLNNIKAVWHPAYDLRFHQGLSLKLSLGEEFLRAERFGRFPT